MFAPLPAPLANDGKADTLLTLTVTDDVNSHSDKIQSITLRMMLSAPATETCEVRINNLLLEAGETEGGWRVYGVKPRQLVMGSNLVGIRVTDRSPDSTT